MSAPAINPVVSNLPGAIPGNAAAAPGQSKADASGFESLMAGMFPQAGTGAVGKGATVAADAAAAAAPDGEQPEEGDGTDAAALLLAAGLAGPVAQAPTQTAEGPPGQANTAPAAWGRDKLRGAPAAPALLHADPKAGLLDKAQAAEDAAADAAAADGAPDPLPAPKGPAAGLRPEPSAPQAAPRSEPATAAAQPPALAAATTVDTPDAAPVPPLQADVAPDANAAAVTASEAPALAAAAEPPPAHAAAAAQAPRPGRSERRAAARDGDAADRPAAATAPAKTGVARAAEVAAEPAADKLEAAAAPRDGDAPKGDATDASVPADARAAAQSQAPAAQAAHVVRGSPETVANLAAQIVKKLGAKTTRFDVELDPMGLGKVDVRVEIGAQGRLSAAMTFDNPQAAQDVKARAAELQRALEQAGFDLSGGISFDVASDRGQQHQQQQQAWENSDQGAGFRGRAFQTALDSASGVAETAMNGALRLRRGITAGVDLRI